MTREIPILFSGPMARAILEGRKTQTRRLVGKRNPPAVGDVLWVRETWKSSEYTCAEEPQDDGHVCGHHCKQTYVYYRATPRHGLRPRPDGASITYLDDSTPLTPWYEIGWRPSIFMPRWACRLELRVTEVRRQRLQDISAADARDEGVKCWICDGPVDGTSENDCGCFHSTATAVDSFQLLWDSINGKRAPWASNPEVFAISFEATGLGAEDDGQRCGDCGGWHDNPEHGT